MTVCLFNNPTKPALIYIPQSDVLKDVKNVSHKTKTDVIPVNPDL